MQEDMGSALYLWFTNASAQNIIIKDDILTPYQLTTTIR